MGAIIVYAEFTDLDIDCWKHNGKLGLAAPFICMKASAEKIAPLIHATDVLSSSLDIDSLNLTLRKSHRLACITTLTLRLSPASDELLEMYLGLESTRALFEFSGEGLASFTSALVTWREGVSDFSCHPNIERAKKHHKQTGTTPRDLASGEVWFWSPYMDP